MIRLDAPLMVSWGLLLGFGLVMVASATVAMDVPYLARHGVHLTLGLMGFLLMLCVPLKVWNHTYQMALLGALTLCALVFVPGFGEEIKGARRWIDFGSFTLQPAEIAKGAMIVYWAGFLARRDEALRESPIPALKPLAWFAALAALLILQRDFGNVAVLGAVLAAMLFLAGLRLRYFSMLTLAAFGALAGLIWMEPYRVERLISFSDPWASAFDSGYQLTHSLIAFGRGEVFGLGLGEGIQKLWYLPEAHHDFIFAVIAEELGLVGALILMALLGLIVARILYTARTALGAGDKFAGYLCYGVALLLGAQTLINAGVATGSLPTKGLTMPFISYGGNSLIVCAALVGLVGRAQLERDSR
ncbi:MAG: putative lipid II flippase FtsW [Gammaproteobacteria bacterium]|nr:putative lipid II flippase FtsW [Gammaproteobacteria bacterium]MYE53265.1 putative lipid II flippase FtsW [Gammaproteobacteria bacterium]